MSKWLTVKANTEDTTEYDYTINIDTRISPEQSALLLSLLKQNDIDQTAYNVVMRDGVIAVVNTNSSGIADGVTGFLDRQKLSYQALK